MEAQLLRGICAARSSSVARQRKTMAVEEFVRMEHPGIRPETREFLGARLEQWRQTGKRPNWPVSVMRACHVTEAEMALMRGRLREKSPVVRKGNFIVDRHGREVPMRPFMVYCSDDVSINEPFRWQDPASGQWLAGRQVLSTIDWHSAGGLGNTAIGRRKDAYRAEDIADHFLDVCQQWGCPQVWILEQGSWAGTFVKGIQVDGLQANWGALDPYLFAVNNEDSPRGKGLIEERFDMLQTLMAITEGGLTMGREPGEFRQVAKLLRRVTYDRRREDDGLPVSPEAVLKLWPSTEMLHALTQAFCRLNARPVQRHWLGGASMVPNEALDGHHGKPIPSEHRWRFCPIKRAAVVRGGCVELKADHYSQPFRFSVSAEEPTIDNGYKVLVAFHPGRPEEGCWIANREPGARNRKGWGMGEVLFNAPYLPLQPQVDLSGNARGTGLRRRHDSAVRTEFRPVREALAEVKDFRRRQLAHAATGRIEERDGRGNRLERQPRSNEVIKGPPPAGHRDGPAPVAASLTVRESAPRSYRQQRGADSARTRQLRALNFDPEALLDQSNPEPERPVDDEAGDLLAESAGGRGAFQEIPADAPAGDASTTAYNLSADDLL